MDLGVVSLFFASLLAATILPFSSEAILAALLLSGEFDPWLLWGAATLGNVLGAQINWGLARYCLRFQTRRWFPVDPQSLSRAGERFRAWGGAWSLLFSWLPLIGDPLTFAAGMFGVPFVRFSLLVALGKAGRYLLVVALIGAE
ncbi:MAG: DedA family protein [Magnetococcales bacterium]|nr:DedA family protein [Magnetococcales bacterium]